VHDGWVMTPSAVREAFFRGGDDMASIGSRGADRRWSGRGRAPTLSASGAACRSSADTWPQPTVEARNPQPARLGAYSAPGPRARGGYVSRNGPNDRHQPEIDLQPRSYRRRRYRGRLAL